MSKPANTIMELIVNNHPGVMSHVTGLFSRRKFNLEGILCSPIDDGLYSRMCLIVNQDERINQIVKQLENLHDIVAVSVRSDPEHVLADRMRELVSELHATSSGEMLRGQNE
jgi:acetolactate synthase-1/3 small subunit